MGEIIIQQNPSRESLLGALEQWCCLQLVSCELCKPVHIAGSLPVHAVQPHWDVQLQCKCDSPVLTKPSRALLQHCCYHSFKADEQ